MSYAQTRRDVMIALGSFYASILLCIAVSPASLSANTGLSYFGVHRYTFLPFALGIFISSYYLYVSAGSFKKPAALVFKTIPILMLGVVATPYSVSNIFDWVHTGFGASLFSLQLLAGLWIAAKIRNDYSNWGLVALQLAGGLISLYYLAPSKGILLQGQLLFQLAFSGLILRNLELLLEM